MGRLLALVFCGLVAASGTAWGASVTVTMRQVNSGGVGEIVGLMDFQDTAKGLKITPNLRGLTPGQHGTHVHESPSCGPAEKDGAKVPGLAAGSHYDPQTTGKHEGPKGEGHLGDLPVLYVGTKGNATRVMWAPRLSTDDLKGRAIVIHSGGDNYSDTPRPLGGGGARVACGVVLN
jgi:Cu-Zn family superoxide dismutase